MPARLRSFDKIICGISSPLKKPRPTLTKVPAIIRTMLYKNPFPRIFMVIISSCLVREHS